MHTYKSQIKGENSLIMNTETKKPLLMALRQSITISVWAQAL